MNELKKLDKETLLDMLAAHTSKYIKMLKDGAPQTEFDACKNLINKISIEIESRKQRTRQKPESPM